jgi:hypothetical protein
MFSFVNWLKECINYYFQEPVKEELIAQINSEKDLQPHLKEDLISSIMLNQPLRVAEQMNHLPTRLREDMMKSMMKAHDPPAIVSQPTETVPHPPIPTVVTETVPEPPTPTTETVLIPKVEPEPTKSKSNRKKNKNHRRR